jgi:hypothetical protein
MKLPTWILPAIAVLALVMLVGGFAIADAIRDSNAKQQQEQLVPEGGADVQFHCIPNSQWTC